MTRTQIDEVSRSASGSKKILRRAIIDEAFCRKDLSRESEVREVAIASNVLLTMFSRSLVSTVRKTAAPSIGAVRNLNVHEYISMELMKSHGIKTPECYVAETPEEAEHVFTSSLNKRK